MYIYSSTAEVVRSILRETIISILASVAVEFYLLTFPRFPLRKKEH